MANELSFRRGAKVRYVRTIYNCWGNPVRTINEVVTIVDVPRDENGCFCCATTYGARVKVRDAKGETYHVECDDCEVYNTIWDLTREELMQLRGQVTLGSYYLSDYDNKYGIDTNQVYTFCEGYGESIGWSEEEDTPEAFADYCEGVERYEEAA